MLHSGARIKHEHPHLDRPWYHDTFEHLDHHPLEGERQDIQLYLCRLFSARRTVTLRTIIGF